MSYVHVFVKIGQYETKVEKYQDSAKNVHRCLGFFFINNLERKRVKNKTLLYPKRVRVFVLQKHHQIDQLHKQNCTVSITKDFRI